MKRNTVRSAENGRFKQVAKYYSTEDITLLNRKGVYSIECAKTNKIYIGSTSVSFHNRFNAHLRDLVNKNHKNPYLQKAFNKYGIDNFDFKILETVEGPSEKVLELEQKWINETNCTCPKIGFNINPLASGTCSLSKATIEKRKNSIRKYYQKASDYYTEWKNKKIKFCSIPDKYQRICIHWSSNNPWNKGIKMKKTDHLKVPKTKTQKLINARKIISAKRREKMPEIFVYNNEGKFIRKWENVMELYQESLSEKFFLSRYMKLRNPKGRNNLPPYVLQPVNVNRCAKTQQQYKGLIFKYGPLQ